MAQDYNVWAMLVAVVANQAIGAAWYSPLLFAKPWMKEVGLTPETLKQGPQRRPFVLAILSSIVLVVGLAWVIAQAGVATLGGGALTGLIAGVGVAAMAAAPHYAFTDKTLRLYLIDMGYEVVAIVVMCAILGVWR